MRTNRLSVVSLVLANCVPLIGVLFWGWSLFSIMFLYWMESAVIGFYNNLKMKMAVGSTPASFTINGTPAANFSRTALIWFFNFHYGIFMMVHRMFVLILFRQGSIQMRETLVALAPLFISHGISYYTNFLGKQEYLRISPSQLFITPYSRILIMHLTVLFSGWAVLKLGSTPLIVGFMVMLKIFVDLYFHHREHVSYGKGIDLR